MIKQRGMAELEGAFCMPVISISGTAAMTERDLSWGDNVTITRTTVLYGKLFAGHNLFN